MKKLFLGLLFSVLLAGTAFAQEWVPVKYYNVKVAPKMVTWHWEGTVPYYPVVVTPVVPVMVYPAYVYAYVPVRRCKRPPCPFEILDRLINGF